MDDSPEDSAFGDCVGVVTGSIRTSQALFVLLPRAALTTHRTHTTVLTRWLPGVIPGQFTTRKFFLFALGLPCLWLFISLCCAVGSGPWVWRIPSCVSSRTNPLPFFELVLTSGVWKVHFCFQFVRDGVLRLFSGLTELSSFRDSQLSRLVLHFSQLLTRRLFFCSSTFFCVWRTSLLAAARLPLYLWFIAVCLPCSFCFDLFQLGFIFARCLSYLEFFRFLVAYIRKFHLKAFIYSITFSVLLGVSSLVTPGISDVVLQLIACYVFHPLHFSWWDQFMFICHLGSVGFKINL